MQTLTAPQSALLPDIEEAGRFLAALDPLAAAFCFQTFDDRGENKSLARTLHGALADIGPQLAHLNQRGAGVFVAPNEIALGQPRTTENAVRVRALFIDVDDPIELPEIERSIGQCHLPPSITVESSPGKRHFYWRVDDCPLDQFKPAQQRLAARFGSDRSICDLPRVMRLSGFYHLKGEPYRSRLVGTA